MKEYKSKIWRRWWFRLIVVALVATSFILATKTGKLFIQCLNVAEAVALFVTWRWCDLQERRFHRLVEAKKNLLQDQNRRQ